MTLWVLLMMVAGNPTPIVAAQSQQKCVAAIAQLLPEQHPPANCVPFSADVVVPTE